MTTCDGPIVAYKLHVLHSFPYKVGYDCAGIVLAVGETVTRVKVGDEVYIRLPESHRGTEFLLTWYI